MYSFRMQRAIGKSICISQKILLQMSGDREIYPWKLPGKYITSTSGKETSLMRSSISKSNDGKFENMFHDLFLIVISSYFCLHNGYFPSNVLQTCLNSIYMYVECPLMHSNTQAHTHIHIYPSSYLYQI